MSGNHAVRNDPTPESIAAEAKRRSEITDIQLVMEPDETGKGRVIFDGKYYGLPMAVIDYYADLRQQLAEAKTKAIPEGYQLVPIEPTETMINAMTGWNDGHAAWHEALAAAKEMK